MKTRVDGIDAVFLVGLVLLGAGLWMFRPWVSLTVVGALLVAVGGMPLTAEIIRRCRNGNHHTNH